MKIDTTKTTVRDLLTQLADADPSEEVVFARTTKKATVACWCGCGGTTKSRFVPGHDSKYHGEAKRVARGEADEAQAIARLPHDEAKAEFARHVAAERARHVAAERPRHAAKEAKKAAKTAQKEAKATEEFPVLAG